VELPSVACDVLLLLLLVANGQKRRGIEKKLKNVRNLQEKQ
jgi:hypothetical protein